MNFPKNPLNLSRKITIIAKLPEKKKQSIERNLWNRVGKRYLDKNHKPTQSKSNKEYEMDFS